MLSPDQKLIRQHKLVRHRIEKQRIIGKRRLQKVYIERVIHTIGFKQKESYIIFFVGQSHPLIMRPADFLEIYPQFKIK